MQTITTDTPTRPVRPLLAAEDLAEAGVREAKRALADALADALAALPFAAHKPHAQALVQLRTRELVRRRAALLHLRAMSGRIEQDARPDLSDLD